MGSTPFQDPLPGFSQTEASRASDADAAWGEITLRRYDAREPRRRPRMSRGVALGLWAVALTAAVGLAYVSQPRSQIEDGPSPADMRPAPEPAPPAPAVAQAAPATSDTAALDPVPSGPPPEPASAEPATQLAAADAVSATESAAQVSAAEPLPAKTAKASSDVEDSPRPVKSTRKLASADEATHAKPVGTAAAKASPRCELKSGEAATACRAAEMAGLRHEMGAAYAQAVKAGTPKAVLKARQAEWAVLRAKAERKGPAAVAALYRARAAQLEALARKAEHKAGGPRSARLSSDLSAG